MANKKQISDVNRKHITYHERISRDYSQHCKCPICARSPIYEDVSEQVYDEKLNRVVKKSKKKVIDNKSFLAQFKCSDFSLDVLISTGAIAKMNSCTLRGSTLNSVSNVDKLMNNIPNNPIDNPTNE